MFNLNDYLEERRRRVDRLLEERLPAATARPAVIHRAMRYSALAGGKRLRPILCLAAAEAVGGVFEVSLLPGAALELLHTYTLIHDDLPAMDNDDLRRGRPTSHRVFGEANAILAGDALLTLAFEWMAACPAPLPYPAAALSLELAQAAGSQGVIGGQVEDIAAEGAAPDPDRLDYIHRHKTGALIRAAVRIGGISAGAGPADLQALTVYGETAGLAFQVADDILNATASPDELGKAVGTDAARGKLTYVTVFGLEAAKARAQALVDQAAASLAPFHERAQPLLALARHLVQRSR